jgi:hypothetical protein
MKTQGKNDSREIFYRKESASIQMRFGCAGRDVRGAGSNQSRVIIFHKLGTTQCQVIVVRYKILTH